MSRQQGFNLIELMTVVAIVSVLVAISLPAYLDNIRRSANNACLAEAKGFSNLVFVALNEAASSLPVPVTSACSRITLSPDRTNVTAYPQGSGDIGVFCDLDSNSVCRLDGSVLP
ncbi:type IV pilin protein [Marinobacterium sp. BA1]|uniref:type IV pilin protein n=1 Tax=Marinobacterium sp. BA1 TaxID=3138931 RepID=UPI0034E87FBE